MENMFQIENGVLIKYSGGDAHVTIPKEVETLGEGAFSYCDTLVDIVIPDSVTFIDRFVFMCCPNLKRIVFPKGVTELFDQVCSDCDNLEHVQLPESLTYIGEYAFAGCPKLKSVMIPESVSYISMTAFDETTDVMIDEKEWKKNLDNFIKAQESTYFTALEEIRRGRKESHWMWYIFPQLRGLGKSLESYVFGIEGLGQAKAYLVHPILGQRLYEISEELLKLEENNPKNILGHIDAMKLKSSMTLFALISEKDSVFHQVLDKFYNGAMDGRTLGLLQKRQ